MHLVWRDGGAKLQGTIKMSKWKLSPKITITLKVVPLHGNASVPPCFPQLENFSECNFYDSQECCLRFLLNQSSQNGRPSTSFSYEGTVQSRRVPNQSLVNPIWLIWHLATLDCFLVWKWSWRAAVLIWMKRFKRNHRQHSRRSQKRHSQKFSSSGK